MTQWRFDVRYEVYGEWTCLYTVVLWDQTNIGSYKQMRFLIHVHVWLDKLEITCYLWLYTLEIVGYGYYTLEIASMGVVH